MKINKSQIVRELRNKMGFTFNESREIYKTLCDIIAGHLLDNNSVILADIGILKPYERKSRKGINPATKEMMMIPSCMKIGFYTSRMLKRRFKKTK